MLHRGPVHEGLWVKLCRKVPAPERQHPGEPEVGRVQKVLERREELQILEEGPASVSVETAELSFPLRIIRGEGGIQQAQSIANSHLHHQLCQLPVEGHQVEAGNRCLAHYEHTASGRTTDRNRGTLQGQRLAVSVVAQREDVDLPLPGTAQREAASGPEAHHLPRPGQRVRRQLLAAKVQEEALALLDQQEHIAPRHCYLWGNLAVQAEHLPREAVPVRVQGVLPPEARADPGLVPRQRASSLGRLELLPLLKRPAVVRVEHQLLPKGDADLPGVPLAPVLRARVGTEELDLAAQHGAGEGLDISRQHVQRAVHECHHEARQGVHLLHGPLGR
mmetsp:Transcript_5851/g.15586  ORF Transcript_5851/g.15586 Transcript_5851/m.15586 type:complete len:334 (+) Transcript_5851:324-1325(+)